jgi:hypothetical protein
MTTDEIRLITFIVLAVLAGASAKYYREKHPRPKMSTPPPREAVGNPSSRYW